MVNYLDIFSEVSWIILIYVGRLTVKCVDILWGVSKWNISMFCWSTRNVFSWCLFERLVVNDHDISSGPSLWKFFIIVETLVVDYLKIMSGISRWILSKVFFRVSCGKLSRYFFGYPKANFLEILSDVSLWIFFIFCRLPYVDLCRCTVSIKYVELYLTVDYCLIFVRDYNNNNNNNNILVLSCSSFLSLLSLPIFLCFIYVLPFFESFLLSYISL